MATGELRPTGANAAPSTEASEEIENALLEAARARKELELVLSSTTDNIVVVDREWNVTYMNERALTSVGQAGLLTIGKNLWAAYPEQIGSDFHKNYVVAFETNRPVHFEGHLEELGIWLEVNAFPTEQGLSIFFRDITEVRKVRERNFHLAYHDSLTGLANRASFLQQLEAATEASLKTGHSIGLIYVDLDDFKIVNDTLGHDAGDKVLTAAADRLRNNVPPSAVVGRLGGDEFAILLTQDVGEQEIEQLMLRLRNTLSSPLVCDGGELSCKASFGVSLYPESDPRPSELMKNADLALYDAKRSGGNQHVFFNPMIRHAVQKRMSALACTRDALGRDGIVPYYQPKVCMKTGRLVGFEALLRWLHPHDGSIQSPGLIGEAFKDPSLSVALYQRMLDRVTREMEAWRRGGLRFGSVAINVSAAELVRTEFSQHLLNTLKSSNLPLDCIEIEITESVFLDDEAQKVERELWELHRSGISIALDDFGTGYASLTHLNKFPVSWLKIDRSFVSAIGTNPDTTAIVKAVMSLSHNIGIQVVAEGVETVAQWEALRQMRCDVAQGYLIAKPMSGPNVPKFLDAWSGIPVSATAKKRSRPASAA